MSAQAKEGLTLFQRSYSRPGPGIPKNAPKKRGVALYMEILLREFGEMVKLNLLFLLFCLPIVTIPAAGTALCRVTLSMVRDRPRFLWAEFRNSFTGNFRKSTIVGTLWLSGVAVVGYTIWFYTAAAQEYPILYILLAAAALMLIVVVMAGQYLFPLIALTDLSFPALIKDALLLGVACLPRSLLALACRGAMLLLAAAFFPLSIPVIVLIWPALVNFTAAFCVYGGIRDYVLKE